MKKIERIERRTSSILCSLPDSLFLSVNHVATHCSHKQIAFSQSQSRWEDGHCTTPPNAPAPVSSHLDSAQRLKGSVRVMLPFFSFQFILKSCPDVDHVIALSRF